MLLETALQPHGTSPTLNITVSLSRLCAAVYSICAGGKCPGKNVQHFCNDMRPVALLTLLCQLHCTFPSCQITLASVPKLSVTSGLQWGSSLQPAAAGSYSSSSTQGSRVRQLPCRDLESELQVRIEGCSTGAGRLCRGKLVCVSCFEWLHCSI
jgi:hypothetical protein